MRKLLIGVAFVVSWVVAMSASAQTVDKKTLSFEAATKIATKAAEEARAIRLDGKVIGAIGVSGDTPQVDEAIALAGAAAFKYGKGASRRSSSIVDSG